MSGSAEAAALAAPPDEVELEAELAELLAALYTKHDGLSERIDQLAARAAAAGNDRYVVLAELTRADMFNRTHRAAEGARIGQRLLESADDPVVAARAHAVISGALWRLGATGESAKHAEQAMALLGEGDPLCVRAEHAVVFAIQVNGYRLGRNPIEWFQSAQRLTEELGSPGLIIANLNNWAWVQYERGELADAIELVERMRQTAERTGLQLNASCVDTLARILLESGDAEQARSVIVGALEGFAAETDSDAIPGCLLTLAEIQRRNDEVDAAIGTLTSCREIAVRSRTAEMGARALRELATCYASVGDYRSAYEHMEAFHREWTQLRSQQAEASASVVQAVFGIEEARRRSREFQRLAERDPLTGLWNRRKSDEHLGELLATPAATRGPVSVAILDLDHFKQVNDRFSHSVGDQVLCAVAQIFREMAGPEGHAVRLGGEEFLLILPMADPAAREHCERVRRAVEAHDWSTLCPGLTVTTSVGVSEIGPGDDYSALLRRADQHLYRAKAYGRNRVISDADGAAR
ncbi:diguanylate cyclase (GGDEF) domain-containing protein [Micromonospora pattaloongensis]|uniref:Diguanylate cyclase (GGDEF) domain-containing protein n=1 Tax=Micromonospora pattaloongensis TaxID=405436 RepID=A0A1H3JD66_9ACTN|nr:GGDEF domain-containing protein [Micromonospora pattaloongensis]SDY37852.1 diguanylate cyclase (GGDEF) domain-containing protein [Micromonospora pattaloongensis]